MKKSENLENLKNLENLGENSKIWKYFLKMTKSENLKNLEIFEKIWKSEKSRNFWKNLEIWKSLKNLKIENPTFFSKIEISILFLVFIEKIFLVHILRRNYFDHSFISKSHICDFRLKFGNSCWIRRTDNKQRTTNNT